MKRNSIILAIAVLITGSALARAQGTTSQPGQAAFGAIKEVVRLLEEDSTTDWSKVNIEALRQHLIDMDDVMMHSVVTQQPVDGGAVMTVTGTGRTVAAIRRVAASHSVMVKHESGYNTAVAEIPNGVRLTVTASDPQNAKAVAKIRGLGFAGLFTEGDHHAVHHMAVARGENPHHMP